MRAAFAALLLVAGAVPAGAAPSPVPPSAVAPAKPDLPQSERPAPPQPKAAASEKQLFAQLAKATSRDDAKPIEEKLQAMFRASDSASITLLMNRADVASAQGDDKMALKLVDAVTRIDPKYAEGWHARATLESQGGDDTAAMLSLQKTIALNPRQFDALSILGGMLEDYGDKAGALKLYRRALALDPQLDGLARHVRALTRDVEGQDI